MALRTRLRSSCSAVLPDTLRTQKYYSIPASTRKLWEERFYDAMTRLEVPAQFADTDECRERTGPAFGVFRHSGRGLDGVHLRRGEVHCAHPQERGGNGLLVLSRLRPEQDRVGSTGGVASGPLSFMQVFDKTTDVIKQGGMRRGANMAILSVAHPDIIRFISIKQETGTLTNFNLSVGVTDDFMQAVLTESDYALLSPRTGKWSEA